MLTVRDMCCSQRLSTLVDPCSVSHPYRVERQPPSLSLWLSNEILHLWHAALSPRTKPSSWQDGRGGILRGWREESKLAGELARCLCQRNLFSALTGHFFPGGQMDFLPLEAPFREGVKRQGVILMVSDGSSLECASCWPVSRCRWISLHKNLQKTAPHASQSSNNTDTDIKVNCGH